MSALKIGKTQRTVLDALELAGEGVEEIVIIAKSWMQVDYILRMAIWLAKERIHGIRIVANFTLKQLTFHETTIRVIAVSALYRVRGYTPRVLVDHAAWHEINLDDSELIFYLNQRRDDLEKKEPRDGA